MTNKKEEQMDLIVVLTGEIVKSNLPAFKEKTLATIEAADRPLVTTQDFEDAAKTIKKCAEFEAAIVAAKEKALSQTADIKELFDTMNEFSGKLAQTRLSLTKKVKLRKSEIKKSVIDKGCDSLRQVILLTANKHIEVNSLISVNRAMFEGAVKGMSKEENMQTAVDSLVESETAKLADIEALIGVNKAAIDSCEYKSLLPDASILVCKPSSEVQLTIDARVAKYILDEKERKEKADAAAKVEADRKAKEEEDKKQAEAKARELASQPEKEAVKPKPDHGVFAAGTYDSTNTSPKVQVNLDPVAIADEEPFCDYVITINLTATLSRAKEVGIELRGRFGNVTLTTG